MRNDVNPDGTMNVPYYTTCMMCGAQLMILSEFVEVECEQCHHKYLGCTMPDSYPRHVLSAQHDKNNKW